ncbi:unnamed protein product, partial [Mesorhabditis belari]|uniref:Peptidase M13 C-terminal domain-containing protein n=1 Tax=Mesorhabditis belari TaxID=2138241 RepID=A0AAF3F5I9_9BILA
MKVFTLVITFIGMNILKNDTVAAKLIPAEVWKKIKQLKRTKFESELVRWADATDSALIDDAAAFISGLRPREVFLQYIQEKELLKNGDLKELQKRVKGLLKVIEKNRMQDELRKKAQRKESFHELAVQSLDRLSLNHPPSKGNTSMMYEALYESLSRIFHDLRLFNNESVIVMNDLLAHITSFYFFAPQEYEAIVLASSFESQNSLKMVELAALLSKHLPASTFKDCSNPINSQINQVFCPCDLEAKRTLQEDLNEIEALEIGHHTLVDALGLKINDIAYKEIPKITNEKMFFYAYAALWCAADPEQNYEWGSYQSASHVRVNSALSYSKEFLRVFECPKHSNFAKLQVGPFMDL